MEVEAGHVRAHLDDEQDGVGQEQSHQRPHPLVCMALERQDGEHERREHRYDHHEQEQVPRRIGDPVQDGGAVVAAPDGESVGAEQARTSGDRDRGRDGEADSQNECERREPPQEPPVAGEPGHQQNREHDRREKDQRLQPDRRRRERSHQDEDLVAEGRVEERAPHLPEQERDDRQEGHLGHDQPGVDEGRKRSSHRRRGQRPPLPSEPARPEVDRDHRDGHEQRLEPLEHDQASAGPEGRQRRAREERVGAQERRRPVEILRVSRQPERAAKQRVVHLVRRDPRRVEPERDREPADHGDHDQSHERDMPPPHPARAHAAPRHCGILKLRGQKGVHRRTRSALSTTPRGVTLEQAVCSRRNYRSRAGRRLRCAEDDPGPCGRGRQRRLLHQEGDRRAARRELIRELRGDGYLVHAARTTVNVFAVLLLLSVIRSCRGRRGAPSPEAAGRASGCSVASTPTFPGHRSATHSRETGRWQQLRSHEIRDETRRHAHPRADHEKPETAICRGGSRRWRQR